MSILLDTKILENNSIEFHNLSVPTTSGGTTYGKGNSGQILKSNGNTVYWGNPVDKELPAKQLSGYYTPGDEIDSTMEVVETGAKSYSASLTAHTVGYGYLFLNGSPGQNVGTYHSSLRLDTTNNSDPYMFVLRPGDTLNITVGLDNPSGLIHNGAKIYSYSTNLTPKASVVLSTQSDPATAMNSTNLLSEDGNGLTELTLPITTTSSTSSSRHYSYSYTNNLNRVRNVYLHIILKVQNSSLYDIRKVSGGMVQTSGVLTYVLKPYLSYSIMNIFDTFPLGSPYCNYGTDGYVIIRNEDSITAMLPDTFYVKRGDFCYKIDSTGIKKSTDGGTVWV